MTCRMQFLYNPFRRHSDCRDKQLSTFVNDDVDQLGKFAAGVIFIRLSRSVSYFWEEKIYTERGIFIFEVRL